MNLCSTIKIVFLSQIAVSLSFKCFVSENAFAATIAAANPSLAAAKTNGRKSPKWHAATAAKFATNAHCLNLGDLGGKNSGNAQ